MHQDPAFQAMTMDILENILSRADNPGKLVDYLAEEMRELTGARCVLLFQCMGNEHKILAVNPQRHRVWADSDDAYRLYGLIHDQLKAEVLYPEIHSECSQILANAGFALSISVPLSVGAVKVGAMLVLGLPDQTHITSEVQILDTLSTIVALVLRNAFLYENQEDIIAERTREVMHSAVTLNSMKDAVYWIDQDSRFSKVNASACTITGYSQEELLSFSVKDLAPTFTMDIWSAHWEELRQAGTLHFETIQQTKDGRTIPVDISANYVELDGKAYNCAIVRDISERKRAEVALKESEERFDLAMRASSDGIFDWNLKTNQIYFSPSWKRMLGYQDDELENDFSVWERLTNPIHKSRSWEILNEHLQGKRDRYEMEFQMLHKKGHWVDILSRANALFDENGKPARVIGTHIDITERKQSEEEHKKLLVQLQQAQKMEAIGTLAGGIAHDFNNILGAIIGYAEMIRDDCSFDSTIAHDINQVLKAGTRAKELVTQILAFSRQAKSDRIPLQPSVIINEAIKLLRASLPTTITIKQYIDQHAGIILADPIQVHQILMNLCTNAFHAMEQKGGTLTISLQKKTLHQNALNTEPHLLPGDYVLLSVMDTGEGIAPEFRGKIFEPYFTTKEVGKGTGMGLATVHGIVQSYGGSITCESQLGKGTVFQIYLPIAAALPLQATEHQETLEVGKEHILLVDDEQILVEMGKTLLERLGYKVTAKASSMEALTAFLNQPDIFDLVITDQTMPGMTGVDLARRILQIRHNMPIILCTGFSNLISEEKAKSMGIREFAMKPLTKKDISLLIRKVLDGKK